MVKSFTGLQYIQDKPSQCIWGFAKSAAQFRKGRGRRTIQWGAPEVNARGTAWDGDMTQVRGASGGCVCFSPPFPLFLPLSGFLK